MYTVLQRCQKQGEIIQERHISTSQARKLEKIAVQGQKENVTTRNIYVDKSNGS